MRIRCLDLLRFGHFTETHVEFPASDRDIHIVFGPNEAGKSTALTAIEDLLFGIDARSPYNFLHDYKDMRIGASLESGDSVLELRRRKGNKDTLLDVDNVPMSGGEGALNAFLKGADRAFFERMFSLDHTRLEQGGREILSASDEVGEMLFAAGAGIAGLRTRLEKLADEADNLWGARRAAKRLYTQAEDRLNDAKRTLREHTLTAKSWNELRKAYEAAEDKCSEIDGRIREAMSEAKRLSRIRRVYRHVRDKRELERRIEELGDIALLPEDAHQTLDNAEREESNAAARIEMVMKRLDQAQREIEELECDEELLARSEDVRMLDERRIEVRRERADLPKRQAELAAAEKDMRALANELGWRDEDVNGLIDRIPARSLVKTVSSLLRKRGELETAVASGTRELENGRTEVIRLQKELQTFGEVYDVSSLSAAVNAVREMGDVDERFLAAAQKTREAANRVQSLLVSLTPSVADEDDLAAIRVPSTADVQSERERLKKCRQAQDANKRDLETSKNDLEIARTQFTQVVRDERAVPLEELKEIRGERDAVWTLVKRRYIEGESLSGEEQTKHQEELQDLPVSFENKMQAADDLADNRFDKAEVSGRLAEMQRSIELQEMRVGQLEREMGDLAQEEKSILAHWTSIWTDAPFEPLSPESMLEWIQARAHLLEGIRDRDAASTLKARTSTELREARERLLAEMQALGGDCSSLQDAQLRIVLARASILAEGRADAKQTFLQLKKELSHAEENVDKRTGELKRAKEALREWEVKWSAEVEKLGLAANQSPTAVEAQIDQIDLVREKAGVIQNLRDERIAKIERDIAGFEEEAEALIEAVARDLRGMPADDAAREVMTRLEKEEGIRDRKAEKQKLVEAEQQTLEELKKTQHESRSSVQHLRDAAGTESKDDLRQAIAKSDQMREYRRRLDETLKLLNDEGDGLSVAELEQECAESEIDQIAADEAAMSEVLKDLQEQRTQAVDVRSQARSAFEAVGGDDAPARAEAARQEALAEMLDVAERYSRVGTSRILLRWAVDRFRREKQAPLLKRAGEIFATLTGGSFSQLQLAYDEHDVPQLIGHRPSGENVQVRGMSGGTADQLYLALRVASIEDYLDRAAGLPFVADDLFINFDDDRAAAGLEVLRELSKKTQVLFFTHHQHLVDVARSVLGQSVNVVSLGVG